MESSSDDEESYRDYGIMLRCASLLCIVITAFLVVMLTIHAVMIHSHLAGETDKRHQSQALQGLARHCL